MLVSLMLVSHMLVSQLLGSLLLLLTLSPMSQLSRVLLTPQLKLPLRLPPTLTPLLLDTTGLDSMVKYSSLPLYHCTCCSVPMFAKVALCRN